MKKIFFVAMAGLVSFACFLKAPSEKQSTQRPKLVIGIVVDQMRADYIDKYWSKFSDGGFRRLVEKGFICRNAHYNYVPTYTGPGHASVYTGCTPSGHGIVGNNWYVRETGKYIYCADDPTVHTVGGTGAAGMMSPVNLMANTIGDQLKLDSKDSKVIGIALKDRGAILPAGHKANAAYWLDGTGNWITSSYYMTALPKWVEEFNKLGLTKMYNSKIWNTLLPIDQYTESIADNNKYEGLFAGETAPVFPHDIPKVMSASGGPAIIRGTPWGNTLTKDFAIETIKSENLGKGPAMDMLAVSFSSTDYVGHMYGPQSVEVEDTYLRLDRDLEEFLKFIDMWFGKDEVMIFLTADHGAVETPGYLVDKGKPGGYMNPQWLADTLRKDLFKTYGDSLVKAYINQEVYLDQKVMDSKKWKSTDLYQHIDGFLKNINGVESTVQLNAGPSDKPSDGVSGFAKNGYYEPRSGDVYVNYKEGWVEHEYTGTTHGSCYDYDTHVPLLWYGWHITPGSTDDKVVIPDIAATLFSTLHITASGEARGKPIMSITK
jgi:predicted AlkP superfamily pyrophosphatase or phosphodiesterase